MNIYQIYERCTIDESKTYEGTPCWNWTGPADGHKYGHVLVDGKMQKTHRLALAAVEGPLTEGLVVRHLCHNTLCCNPKHLKEGTQKENYNDSLAKHMEARYVPVQVLGITYESKKAACDALGLHPVILDKYLEGDVFNWEAYENRRVTKKWDDNRHMGDWIVGNKTYSSLKEASEATGVSIHYLHKYSENGIVMMHEILLRMQGFVKREVHSTRRPITVRGVVYGSRKEACRALKITMADLLKYTKDDVFDHERFDNRKQYTKSKEKRVGDFTVDGVTYPSIREACKATGIAVWKLHRYSKDGVYDPSLKKYKKLPKEEVARIEKDIDTYIQNLPMDMRM